MFSNYTNQPKSTAEHGFIWSRGPISVEDSICIYDLMKSMNPKICGH